MTKLFSLLCLFPLMGISFIGCSTVRFASDDTIPVIFESKEDHTRDISFQVSKDFYLWGLVPGARELLLDKEFGKRGFDSVADVEVREERSGRDLAWTFFSFGFYSPKSFLLKGKAKKQD